MRTPAFSFHIIDATRPIDRFTPPFFSFPSPLRFALYALLCPFSHCTTPVSHKTSSSKSSKERISCTSYLGRPGLSRIDLRLSRLASTTCLTDTSPARARHYSYSSCPTMNAVCLCSPYCCTYSPLYCSSCESWQSYHHCKSYTRRKVDNSIKDTTVENANREHARLLQVNRRLHEILASPFSCI